MNTARYRKTKLMQKVEDQLGQPLERALPRMIAESGISETALQMGVSKATINYWMLKMGMQVQRVAVRADQEVVIRRPA